MAASAESVKSLGVAYECLDALYEKSRNFDTLQKNIAKEVLRLGKEGDVCYLVDGSVSEDRASAYIRQRAKTVVIDGVSKAAHFASRAGFDRYTALSAYDCPSYERASLPLIVYDLDNAFLAGDVKLRLSKLLGEECTVTFFHGEEQRRILLYELDRQGEYDYRTAVCIEELPLLRKERFDFTDLENLVRLLRAPGGCPWDRVQTNESIKTNVVEEAYELLDAIESGEDEHIREETGDVLLQAVFHAVIKEEEGAFDSIDAITALCKKLIFRHSHIFGTDKATGDQEALGVWDKNKRIEKGQKTFSDSVSDVPKAMPALMRAQKVGKRAGKSGMDFSSAESALSHALGEIEELKEACRKGNEEEIAEELGDILFAIVNVARLLKVDAEFALKGTVDKFISRFAKTEELVLADGKRMEELDGETLDSYYRRAKECLQPTK